MTWQVAVLAFAMLLLGSCSSGMGSSMTGPSTQGGAAPQGGSAGGGGRSDTGSGAGGSHM